jgi:isopentenyl-diphosphate delta-isomerase
VAPDILLLGNIGLAQAIQAKPEDIKRLVEAVGADALCVHVNVAMELIQDHGDRNFRGGMAALRNLRKSLDRPLIVKETGCGFSREVGRKLKTIGIRHIDVSGAGGTSWVGIETLRSSERDDVGAVFWDWGLPTAASLCELREFKFELIASGGIRHGLDIARALALGARCAGVAQPIIRAYLQEGVRGVEAYLSALYRGFKMAMLLTGSRTCDALRKNKAIIRGRLRDWIAARGLKEKNETADERG